MSPWRRVLSAADNRSSSSWAGRMRGRRHTAMLEMLNATNDQPKRVLDIGGSAVYWQTNGMPTPESIYELVILNLSPQRFDGELPPNVTLATGDARSLPEFDAGSFDFIFSNSVIEHVGSYADQISMAREIRRLSSSYFVQTPYRYFPVEPHFLFPLFQFLPIEVAARLHRRFRLGWMGRASSLEDARIAVSSIRLLTKGEMSDLFPGSRIHKERALWLTKSLIAVRSPPT